MIVDNLKSCYRTFMRVRLDPELIVPVRWYFCPDGALPLPTETAFGSSVWETVDREYPQPGLGEVSLQRTWDKGIPPPGVTGRSTPTPLDWFVNGLPADFVYPPPNPCQPVRIDVTKEIAAVNGSPATVTDEAAIAALAEELPSLDQWQFLLFQLPAVLTPATTYADVFEASFPGYARQSAVWAPPVLTNPAEATSYAPTLTWTRGAGTDPAETIFGWAAVGPGLPARLRRIQLFTPPILIANPGDNVSLGPLSVTYNPEAEEMPAGMVADFAGTLAPTGWLLCDGTDYAEADYPELFGAIGHLWDTFRGQAAPASGRFRVPLANGLAGIAAGANASNPTTSVRAVGDVLGEETHVLTKPELAAHDHAVTDPGHLHNAINGYGLWSTQGGFHNFDEGTANPIGGQSTTDLKSTGITIATEGSNSPHNNMQPSVAWLKIIKT
jgi:microcystin-dependent protein